MPLIPFVMFAAFAALAVAMHFRLRSQGYRPGGGAPRRQVDYQFDPPNSVVLTGGARIGGTNASVPLAALTLDHRWAQIRIRLPLLGGTPAWISREEVVAVRRISGVLGNGIMFDTAHGHLDGIIFWTFDTAQVLRAFAWYDWPVREAEGPGAS